MCALRRAPRHAAAPPDRPGRSHRRRPPGRGRSPAAGPHGLPGLTRPPAGGAPPAGAPPALPGRPPPGPAPPADPPEPSRGEEDMPLLEPPREPRTVTLPARPARHGGRTDVLVVGGGPAGTAAAHS